MYNGRMKSSTKQAIEALLSNRLSSFKLDQEASVLEHQVKLLERAHTRLKLTDKDGEVTYSPYGEHLSLQFQLYLEQQGVKIEHDRNEPVIKLGTLKLQTEAASKRLDAKAARTAFTKGLKQLPPLDGAQLWKAIDKLMDRDLNDYDQDELFMGLYKNA